MTKFSVVSSWLASIACGVCLVLAVLATPGVARADPDCSCCGADPGAGDYAGHQQWMNCMSQCAATGTCDGGGNCGGKNANGCTAMMEVDCGGQGTVCRTMNGGVCDCKWYDTAVPNTGYCGCFSAAP